MKLIVGLGNPGEKYKNHRHNVGFDVVDQLANVNQGSAWSKGFDSLTCECWIGSEKVMLAKPQTYMNRSGQAVRKIVDFYKTSVNDLLIACDDINLPVGKLRLRAKGSSGGQNGLKDVFRHLATDEISRLRVGVGSPAGRDAADHVLSGFSKSEKQQIDDAVIDAARAAETWCLQGIEAAMNQFNGKQPAKE